MKKARKTVGGEKTMYLHQGISCFSSTHRCKNIQSNIHQLLHSKNTQAMKSTTNDTKIKLQKKTELQQQIYRPNTFAILDTESCCIHNLYTPILDVTSTHVTGSFLHYWKCETGWLVKKVSITSMSQLIQTPNLSPE